MLPLAETISTLVGKGIALAKMAGSWGFGPAPMLTVGFGNNFGECRFPYDSETSEINLHAPTLVFEPHTPGVNPSQIYKLLPTGPSPGARLGIPPRAFISSGTVNVVNLVTIPNGGNP